MTWQTICMAGGAQLNLLVTMCGAQKCFNSHEAQNNLLAIVKLYSCVVYLRMNKQFDHSYSLYITVLKWFSYIENKCPRPPISSNVARETTILLLGLKHRYIAKINKKGIFTSSALCHVYGSLRQAAKNLKTFHNDPVRTTFNEGKIQ